MSGITRDDWLSAVNEAGPANDQNAMTSAELGASLGIKHTTMRARLRLLLSEGRAVRTFKNITDAAGRTQSVAAYRLVTPRKKR